jgi:nitroreductase
MGRDQWADVGMFMQTIMLLAREHGLHTCAQEAWASWHATISEYLQLPAEQMVFCGMAMGFRDEAAPINQLRTQRAALEEFATLQGFDQGQRHSPDGLQESERWAGESPPAR